MILGLCLNFETQGTTNLAQRIKRFFSITVRPFKTAEKERERERVKEREIESERKKANNTPLTTGLLLSLKKNRLASVGSNFHRSQVAGIQGPSGT